MKKNYSKEELKNIEELASKYNFVEMGYKLGLSANHFLKLRKNHRQVKEAIDRGILARGQEYKDKYRKKQSDQMKKSHKMKNLKIKAPSEVDPKEALKKFKEKFEANKYKESLRELKDLDIL